jgi:hypothetical protein
MIPSNKSSKSIMSIATAEGKVLRTELVDSKDLAKVESEFNIQVDQLKALGQDVKVIKQQRITG